MTLYHVYLARKGCEQVFHLCVVFPRSQVNSCRYACRMHMWLSSRCFKQDGMMRHTAISRHEQSVPVCCFSSSNQICKWMPLFKKKREIQPVVQSSLINAVSATHFNLQETTEEQQRQGTLDVTQASNSPKVHVSVPFSASGQSISDEEVTTVESSSPALKVKQHKEHMIENLSFLQQYNEDLNTMLEKVSKRTLKVEKVPKATEEDKKTALEKLPVEEIKPKLKRGQKRSSVNMRKAPVRYPLWNLSRSEPLMKPEYKQSKLFLESLGIPCDELICYPDIQVMKNNDVLDCLLWLKNNDIHRVFSLFLIQRSFLEMQLEKTRVRRVSKPNKSLKLKNGMYRLMSVHDVRKYLELCKLLDTEDLDICKLIDDLVAIGIHEGLGSILRKTRKLRSVGATGQDILSNLSLFSGYELFDEKIKLYKSLFPGDNPGPFSVQLFQSSRLRDFKEGLSIEEEANNVAKLLGVTVTDIQACWGCIGDIKMKPLVFKIHMCLSAGISQRDIFNNLNILNRLSINKCYSVTKAFRTSGMPASVYVFRDMDRALQHMKAKKRNVQSDWTIDDSQGQGTVSKSSPSPPQLSSNEEESLRLQKKKDIVSCKKWRMELFKLIGKLLQLAPADLTRMYQCNVMPEATELIDVTKNLDYLLSLKLSKEQIATCPLILAHPHESLVRVSRLAPQLVGQNLHSSLCSSPSSGSSYLSVADSEVGFEDIRTKSFTKFFSPKSEEHRVMKSLFVNPTSYLNTLQYLLEKNEKFGLENMDNYTFGVGFIN